MQSDDIQATAARTSRAAAVALGCFVVYLVAPGVIRVVVFALMAAAVVWVVACAVIGSRHPSSAVRLHWVAGASAVGMVSSVLYLVSLAGGGPALPLLGVLLLLVSINGLFVASLLLRRTARRGR